MLLANKIGGQTKAETNNFRRTISKKYKSADAEAKRFEKVEAYHKLWMETATKPENLGDAKKAEDLWDLVQSFCSYGFNKSISFDEIVRDKIRGNISILDVVHLKKAGETVEIKSADESGNDIWVEVVNTYDHGVLDLVEVEMEDGTKIKCTLDHKFRTNENKMLPLWEILNKNLEIIGVEF
jgi:hypothetical protein